MIVKEIRRELIGQMFFKNGLMQGRIKNVTLIPDVNLIALSGGCLINSRIPYNWFELVTLDEATKLVEEHKTTSCVEEDLNVLRIRKEIVR